MRRDALTQEQSARLDKAVAEGDPELLRQVSLELTAEQRAQLDAMHAGAEAELLRQMRRVNVELTLDAPELVTYLDEAVRISENVFALDEYVDHSVVLRTLRELPDGAGTDMFWTAYKHKWGNEAALARHIRRVKVNMPSALQQLRCDHPSLVRMPETALTTALLHTLEALADGAGTEAFIAAYSARSGSS